MASCFTTMADMLEEGGGGAGSLEITKPAAADFSVSAFLGGFGVYYGMACAFGAWCSTSVGRVWRPMRFGIQVWLCCLAFGGCVGFCS